MLEKIKNLLQEKAPKILDALQGPATDVSIQSLENLVGKQLPNGFIQLYKEHNGTKPDQYANFAYGVPFIPIEQSIAQIESYIQNTHNTHLMYADVGIKIDYLFGPLRIPIGDDCGTSLICVDLDPAEEGIYGQVILIDYEFDIALRLNDSVELYLIKFEEDLEAGNYSLQEDALEDGVHWLEPIREIDPVNWFNSPTWSYVNKEMNA